jgi:glycogen operon protein
MRRWWLDQGVDRATFARRFCGSADLFHQGRRSPLASVNFITAHDGFTLADLTSYSHKHNEANGEDNRDGRDGEPCAAFGAEGPSDDPAIKETRRRVRRALLATVLLAQGTPMLAAGDETGHSQGGNNNAYCQDNPVGWIDWSAADPAMTAFAAQVLSLRRSHPLLRHDRWFHPRPGHHGEPVLTWQRPDGRPLAVGDWHDGADRALACRIEPGRPAGPAEVAKEAKGAQEAQVAQEALPTSLWIAFNPGNEPVRFTLPPGPWVLRLDTAEGDAASPSRPPASHGAHDGAAGSEGVEGVLGVSEAMIVSARSLVVLESVLP